MILGQKKNVVIDFFFFSFPKFRFNFEHFQTKHELHS